MHPHKNSTSLFLLCNARQRYMLKQKQHSSTFLFAALTRLILSEGDDVLVEAVDEFGEATGLVLSHTDLIILPLSCQGVLPQRHQTSENNKKVLLSKVSLT